MLCGAAYSLTLKQVETAPASMAEAEAEGWNPGCSNGCWNTGCRPRCYRPVAPKQPPTLKQVGCALYDIDDRLCDLQDCVDDLKADPVDDCWVTVYNIDTGSELNDLPDYGGSFDGKTTVQEVYDAILGDASGDWDTIDTDWGFVLERILDDGTGSLYYSNLYSNSKTITLEGIKKDLDLCPEQDVRINFVGKTGA